MSSTTEVDVEIKDHRATITFRTEGGLNVMSPPVLEKLGAAVQKVAAADDVRTCVIRAEGKVFIAGADIKAMSKFGPDDAREMAQNGHKVVDAIANLRPVTVAVIHGVAAGGGLEIPLACDFRIAVEGVLMGLPETSLGLIPGWGGTQRLPAIVGVARAKRLMFSAALIKAEEAFEMGLVDHLVKDPAALAEEVETFIKQFSRGGPDAIGLVKRSILTGNEVSAFADCFKSAQSGAGMNAFLEKGKPHWVKEPR
jgi:enoyl-CoA hydratase